LEGIFSRIEKMKTLSLLMGLMLIGCGKPKNEGEFPTDHILPRTIVTQVPHRTGPKTKAKCYLNDNTDHLIPTLMLVGSFYQGIIYFCDGGFDVCTGNGVYVHYFNHDLSCFTKKGFENEFTICMNIKGAEERSSNVGPLVKLLRSVSSSNLDVWCEKKIISVMLSDSTEA
jgi:hypothetical protein